MGTVNFDQRSDKLSGSGSGGDYQNLGVGNNEKASVNPTKSGKFPGDNGGPNRSTGETPGAGVSYSVTLNERPNISNPRNRGPERAPSRSGSTAIPMVEASSRATGKISG